MRRRDGNADAANAADAPRTGTTGPATSGSQILNHLSVDARMINASGIGTVLYNVMVRLPQYLEG